MLVLIDNYDSFTFNLVQLIGVVDPDLQVRVIRNDKITVDGVRDLDPSHLLVSPGPCTPAEGGVSNDLVRELGPSVPTLGVCLGHQCIAHAHGGTIERAAKLMHGKSDRIHHDGTGLFAGVPSPFTAARYHSLILRPGTLSGDWLVTATTADEAEIMAVRHREHPIHGLQFHPESFLTEHGETLIGNFLKLEKPGASAVPALSS